MIFEDKKIIHDIDVTDDMLVDKFVYNGDKPIPGGKFAEGRSFQMFKYKDEYWILKFSEREKSRSMYPEIIRSMFVQELAKYFGILDYIAEYKVVEYKGRKLLASKSFLGDATESKFVSATESKFVSAIIIKELVFGDFYTKMSRFWVEVCLNDQNLEDAIEGHKKIAAYALIDSAVNERDRFNKNVGLIVKDGKYAVAPCFDTECNLYFVPFKECTTGSTNYGDLSDWKIEVSNDKYRGVEDWSLVNKIINRCTVTRNAITLNNPIQVIQKVYKDMLKRFPDSDELIEGMCRAVLGRLLWLHYEFTIDGAIEAVESIVFE